MVKTIMALIPLDDRYEAELLMEFDRISRACGAGHSLFSNHSRCCGRVGLLRSRLCQAWCY